MKTILMPFIISFLQGKLVSEIENLRCELQERDGVCRNHINVIAELEEELETLKEEAERKDPKASNVSLQITKQIIYFK